MHEFTIVVLPEGSFFGEVAAMLNTITIFGYKATSRTSQTDKYMIKGHEFVQIYECHNLVFQDILSEHPDFANSVYIRGEMRLAYFKDIAEKTIS